MKKLFAVLLTFLLVFSLPVLAMAEEATNAPDTSAEEVTAASEAATEDASEEVTESESETEPVIKFGFYPETALVTLPIMGMGMLGIFLVTLVIILAVIVLSKIGKGKEEE